MFALFMIGFLVVSMLLNVLTMAYLILYFDYFQSLNLNGVVSSLLAGLIYICVLVGGMYICAVATQWSFISEESIGKTNNSPLMLFLLFMLQSIPALVVYQLSKRKKIVNVSV